MTSILFIFFFLNANKMLSISDLSVCCFLFSFVNYDLEFAYLAVTLE
jgi:hypothetical protein